MLNRESSEEEKHAIPPEMDSPSASGDKISFDIDLEAVKKANENLLKTIKAFY